MACWEKELAVDHRHTCLTTQRHEGSPQMSDQFNAGATSETTQILMTVRQHSLTHSFQQGGYDRDAYDGQMIFGDLVGLKLPDICLAGE